MTIAQIGLPAGFQGVLFSISNVILQSSINTFGDTIIAANAAAANIEGFTYMAMNAFIRRPYPLRDRMPEPEDLTG